MLSVRETSTIGVSPERIWAFLIALDGKRYRAWHLRDHKSFRRLRDARSPDGVGQVVYFSEDIGGRRYRFVCEITRSAPGRFVEFCLPRPLNALRAGCGYFLLTARGDDATCVEAVVELGWSSGPFRAVGDRLVRRAVDLQALQAHMREEGVYLEKAAR